MGEAEVQTIYKQDIATAKEELTEKVDSYLSYVVEEWMKENEIALERGIKGEIAEDFITGLKKLFSEHYIDVPDEKYDVLEAQATKIEDLKKKCETIKESYFGKKESKDESLDDVAAAGPSSLNSEDLSKAMAAYTAAISKTKDIKIS